MIFYFMFNVLKHSMPEKSISKALYEDVMQTATTTVCNPVVNKITLC